MIGIFYGLSALINGAAIIVAHRSLPTKKEVRVDMSGPEYEFDPRSTATGRWMTLAALEPKYTENVLRWMHGHDVVDAAKAELKELYAGAAPAELPTEPQSISFRPGEPQAFAEAENQRHIIDVFDVFVHNMDAAWPALRPQMFVGGAGRGKTSLAKLVGQEIRDRLRELKLPTGHFIESYGGDLANDSKLDAVVRLASSRPGSVLFIDEVHSMPRSQRERLYMLGDRDWRFKFAEDQLAMPLAPFTVIFATTDRGLLDEPMRTRCQIWELDMASEADLFKVAMHFTVPVDPLAAKLAVSRIRWDGSVRPLIQILELSEQFAKRSSRTSIREADVYEVFRSQQMDEWGLKPHDRAVVRTLMKSSKPVKVKKGEAPRIVHQMAEGTLCAWARIDVASYREEIKPRLMDRGFLLSMSTGQTLTDAGVAYASAHQLSQ